MYFFLVALLLAISCNQLTADRQSIDSVKVHTPLGSVVGEVIGNVNEFKGIPFGEPPVGDLRFRSPRPVKPWSEDLLPRRGIKCPQLAVGGPLKTFQGSEDCLYLDVFAPNGLLENETVPVMVYLYGGAFVMGDSSQEKWYDGHNIASTQRVILVVPNYRVNAFGFLATQELRDEDDDGSTGNYGIQDQRLALHWVQDNIASFGGNKDKVTIFGQSAGGMSVCTHFANKHNSGLFEAAVMESGSCDSPEFIFPLGKALEFGELYASLLGCGDVNGGEKLACLRKIDTADIMWGFVRAIFGPEPPPDFEPVLAPLFGFGPVIDGTEKGLPLMPYESIVKGEHNANVRFIAGTVANEGSIFVPMTKFIVPGTTLPLKDGMQSLVLHHVLDARIGKDGVDANIGTLLDVYYPLSELKTVDNQMSKILRDYIFTCGTRRVLRWTDKWSTDKNIRGYYFDYTTDWEDMKIGGSYHTSELYFVFNNSWPTEIHHFSERDENIVEVVQDFWVGFARDDSAALDAWPRFGLDERDTIIHFVKEGGVAWSYKDEFGDVCDFMDSLFDDFPIDR